jgi:molecular chaperone DnaK (HSP70)
MAPEDSSLLVSVSSAIGTGIAILSFWMRLSDRIIKADAKADSALQNAIEAKNDSEAMREEFAEMIRTFEERLDRYRRDEGEGLAAIRQHVTELALFLRDNFVRRADFTAAMSDIKTGQRDVESKLDDLTIQIVGGRRTKPP